MIKKLEVNNLYDVSEIIQINVNNGSWPAGGSWTTEKLNDEFLRGSCFGSWNQSGNLAAFIFFRSVPDRIEVMALATTPNEQGKGHMRALFEKMMEVDKEVWLEVHEQNESSIKFYKSMGFKEQGRRPRYYPDNFAAIIFRWTP